MTPDITELAQRARINAECGEHLSPAETIELVEALEKAQQRIDELENDEVRQRLANAEHQLYLAELAKHNLKASRKAQFRKRRAAEKRIAELESRTVTVKLASRRLPSDYVDGEFGNDDLAAIHNACRLECKVSVEKYLSAHGIVVKWEAE
ncbi:Uncharacterised protein [Klebsiella pneumoniae]|uniref:hypothetical protein n=1 Tax=Klebsiella pneumoniae TaxID=573 RepID=UPI0007CC4338|nr:hypothetical protein [Klebsiella pneumoniae]MCD9720953.1 hypothetical protein [Klebsiella pneumoniae]SAU72853.1 Uncharacterised protein [Klebsiella pneumoniae]SXT02086.1 Uncharacterised protein [Klebsiella pneumoniae]SYA20157.1 Uncharacterised protein [Klebsiella pneumoniae]